MKKKVLVLVFSDLRHDARVLRQVQWLQERYAVTVVCFAAEASGGLNIIRIRQTKLSPVRKILLAAALLTRQFGIAYRLYHNYSPALKKLKGEEFHLIIANDIDTLPLAVNLRNRAKIVFDAHEYAPRHFENNRIWKIFFQPFYIALCKKYIPQASAMLTVSQGLAREYRKNFDVAPLVITNATRYADIQPSPVHADRIRIVHHGIINASRKLELLVEMMHHLDERFTLDLMLMISDFASPQTKAYVESFRKYAQQHPRISFVPPVQSHAIVKSINPYDIGVFLIPPVNFNYANTLPNKLFDFIQARLAIAIGPTPEMAAIVNKYQNGVISSDFDPKNLAQKLNSLSADDIKRFKQQSAIAARELNAEKNQLAFNQLLDKLEK